MRLRICRVFQCAGFLKLVKFGKSWWWRCDGHVCDEVRCVLFSDHSPSHLIQIRFFAVTVFVQDCYIGWRLEFYHSPVPFVVHLPEAFYYKTGSYAIVTVPYA